MFLQMAEDDILRIESRITMRVICFPRETQAQGYQSQRRREGIEVVSSVCASSQDRPTEPGHWRQTQLSAHGEVRSAEEPCGFLPPVATNTVSQEYTGCPFPQFILFQR